MKRILLGVFPSLTEALEWDGGRYIDFVRLTGVRKEGITPINPYDAGLIASLKGGHAKQN